MISESRTKRIALYLITGALLLWALVPYYWVFRSSVISTVDAASKETPFLIIPFLSEAFSLTGYQLIWESYNFGTYFKNSILVSVACTLLAVVLAIPGAYAFARLDFPGRKFLFYTVVFTITFPWIVLTIPVYGIFYDLGLINTYLGIILALTLFVLPLCIWLLQGFFRQGIPPNLEEAAMLDGLSEIGAFVRIVLPLSLPAVGAASLFAFLSAWNNFAWVFILTNDENKRTATVAVHYILGSDTLRQWNALMAAVTILVLPPVLFYGVMQTSVGEGLGGVQ